MKAFLVSLIVMFSLKSYSAEFFHLYGPIENSPEASQSLLKLIEQINKIPNVHVYTNNGFCQPSYDLYDSNVFQLSCLISYEDDSAFENINSMINSVSAMTLRLDKIESMGMRYQFIGFDRKYASYSLEMALNISFPEEILSFSDIFIKTVKPKMGDYEWIKFLNQSKENFGDYHISKIKEIARRVNLWAVRTILNVEFKSHYEWQKSNVFFSSEFMSWNECENNLSDLFLNY